MKSKMKGAETSLKSDAVDLIEIEIRKVLSKPHKIVEKPDLINPFIDQIEHVFRNMEHIIQCEYNSLYEGFIFVAWIENSKLYTKVIKI